jgi:hypothetical protein
MMNRVGRWVRSIFLLTGLLVGGDYAALNLDMTQRLNAFLQDYYRSGESNDIAWGLHFYADTVDYYFGQHRVDHRYIVRDKRKYFRKWPIRRYRLLDWRLVYKNGDIYNGTLSVQTHFFWEVERGGTFKSGEGEGQIDIEVEHGRFLITGVGNPRPSLRKVHRVARRSLVGRRGYVEVYEENRDLDPHYFYLHTYKAGTSWWFRIPDDTLADVQLSFVGRNYALLKASGLMLLTLHSYIVDLQRSFVTVTPGAAYKVINQSVLSDEPWYLYDRQGKSQGYVWIKTRRNVQGKLIQFQETLPASTPCQTVSTVQWGSVSPGCMRIRDLIRNHSDIGPLFQQSLSTKIRYRTD